MYKFDKFHQIKEKSANEVEHKWDTQIKKAHGVVESFVIKFSKEHI